MYKSIALIAFLLVVSSFGCKTISPSSDSAQNPQQKDILEILEKALEIGPYSFVFSEPLHRDGAIESELPLFISGARALVLYSNFNRAVDNYLNDSSSVASGFFDLTPLSSLAKISLFKPGHAFEINNRSTDPNIAFAHYNPNWVIWASENLIPNPESEINGISAQSWYDKSFKRFFRLLVESHELLEKRELWEYESRNYYEALKSTEFNAFRYFDRRFQNELPEYAYPYSHQVMTGPMAISFWLRRELDGSRGIFRMGLLKFMNQYDQQWLLEHT
jgi:hypothetical protein